ncbi:MAG: hypothetical protein GXY86_17255 [Firmicutes bacterium]|nr:hypothetical protein [Bacillota bacterium]
MSKKSILILIIVLGISFSFGLTFIKNRVKLTAQDPLILEDFIIDGIELREPMSNVLERLGQPEKITKTEDAIYYYYSNLTIESLLIKGPEGIINKVDCVLISEKDIQSFRGIRIGDKEEKVIYRYGEIKKNDNRLIYEKGIGTLIYAISFEIDAGLVKEIATYNAID